MRPGSAIEWPPAIMPGSARGACEFARGARAAARGE